jgi:hypothetical protein
MRDEVKAFGYRALAGALDGNDARVGPETARHERQERRFPGAVAACDHQRLARGEIERQSIEDEAAGAAAGEILDGDPHQPRPLTFPYPRTVQNRVAGRCEMIYRALQGCAARQGVQSASRAITRPGTPGAARANQRIGRTNLFAPADEDSP